MEYINIEELENGVQVRCSMNAETVNSYAEIIESKGWIFPPVAVCRFNGTYHIADGHHRIEACKIAGLASVPCDIFDGDRETMFSTACDRNSSHGLPMGNNDKRHSVVLAVDMFPEKSYREIADLCHCSLATVQRTLDEISTPKSFDILSFFPEWRDFRLECLREHVRLWKTANPAECPIDEDELEIRPEIDSDESDPKMPLNEAEQLCTYYIAMMLDAKDRWDSGKCFALGGMLRDVFIRENRHAVEILAFCDTKARDKKLGFFVAPLVGANDIVLLHYRKLANGNGAFRKTTVFWNGAGEITSRSHWVDRPWGGGSERSIYGNFLQLCEKYIQF